MRCRNTSRRQHKRLLDLIGKLEWDESFIYKACWSIPESGHWFFGATAHRDLQQSRRSARPSRAALPS